MFETTIGALKTAKITLRNPTNQTFTYVVKIFFGEGLVEVASNSIQLAGEQESQMSLPVTMPVVPGVYPVFVGVFHNTVNIALMRATEDIKVVDTTEHGDLSSASYSNMIAEPQVVTVRINGELTNETVRIRINVANPRLTGPGIPITGDVQLTGAINASQSVTLEVQQMKTVEFNEVVTWLGFEKVYCGGLEVTIKGEESYVNMPPPPGSYKCPMCSYEGDSEREIELHIGSEHYGWLVPACRVSEFGREVAEYHTGQLVVRRCMYSGDYGDPQIVSQTSLNRTYTAWDNWSNCNHLIGFYEHYLDVISYMNVIRGESNAWSIVHSARINFWNKYSLVHGSLITIPTQYLAPGYYIGWDSALPPDEAPDDPGEWQLYSQWLDDIPADNAYYPHGGGGTVITTVAGWGIGVPSDIYTVMVIHGPHEPTRYEYIFGVDWMVILDKFTPIPDDYWGWGYQTVFSTWYFYRYVSEVGKYGRVTRVQSGDWIPY